MKRTVKILSVLALAGVVWFTSFAGIKETFEDLIGGPKVTLDVSKTPVTESKKTDGTVEYTVGKKKFSSALSIKKSIAGGKMKYSVPSEYEKVESPIENIAGNQYKLNEIPNQFRTSAEDLFVYYFSNDKYLLNLNDRNQREAIEMAIVKNILPEARVDGFFDRIQFPTKTLTAKYKTADGKTEKKEFDYFPTTFRDSARKTHNIEFVFTRNGDDGIGCILYVFTEPVHKEDVLYIMRTIEF